MEAVRKSKKARRRRKLDDEDLPAGLVWLDADAVRDPTQRELLRDAAIIFGVTQDSIRRALRPRVTAHRLHDIIGLYEQAAKCLKDPAPWFRTPNPSLGGKTPLEALGAETGLETVTNLLTRIEFGTAA